MLAIGRCLMGQPRLIMFDEPSLGLAPTIVQEVFRIVRRLNEEGLTILLVEQNVMASLKIAHRGYVLENGRIELSGHWSRASDQRPRAPGLSRPLATVDGRGIGLQSCRLPVQTAAACGAGWSGTAWTLPSTGRPPSPADRALGRNLRMNRRDMLKAGVAAGALGLAPRLASAQVTFAPAPKGWRSYALTDAGRADGRRHPGLDPAADLRGGRLAAPGQRHLDRQCQGRRARARPEVRRGDAAGRMGGRPAIAGDRGRGAGPDPGPLASCRARARRRR